jgi:hypothetical protein
MTTQHTTWCAQGHLCNLGEHRADPLRIDIDPGGVAVLTRVRDRAGREHAEIRLRLALHTAEPAARRELAHLLTELQDLLTRINHPQRSSQ